MKDGKKSKTSKDKASAPKAKVTPDETPKATSTPKTPRRKSSKGYDPEKDGPLHKDHPLVNELNALSHKFFEHSYFYVDDGAFAVHRILDAIRRAMRQDKGNDLCREKSVYSAARKLLRDYGDPMLDEDKNRRAHGFQSLAGPFRVFSEKLALLIRGHKVAHDPVQIEAKQNQQLAEMVAALKNEGFTAENADQIPREKLEPLISLAKEVITDPYAHVLARFSYHPMGVVPLDHWRTPAKFEDNVQMIRPRLTMYFPQIPSIQNARRDPDSYEKLGARIEAYLKNLDKLRAIKMAECQKLGIDYSVHELAEDLAEDILRNECRFSGMKETAINKLFGFLNEHKKKGR